MRLFFSAALFAVLSSLSFGQDLAKLIKEGDLAAIQKMNEKGADIDEILAIPYNHPEIDDWQDAYMHPMAYAAARNQMEIVKFYLDRKEIIVEGGDWDWILGQAFVVSLSTKNDELISMLYALGPNLDEVCESCWSQNAVMIAAAYGLDKWYFELKEKSNLQLVSSSGGSLLHAAIYGKSMTIIQDVVSSGVCDINQANLEGYSPLDFAARDSNAAAFKFLLEQGADLESQVNLWFSVAYGGNMEIFRILVEKYPTALMLEYYDVVELPLVYALGYNYPEMALEMMRIMKIEIVQNGIYLDSAPFSEADVHPLYMTVFYQNKETYESLFELVHITNTAMEDPEYITFPKYILKDANKTFGKEFVAGVSAKYPVVWY